MSWLVAGLDDQGGGVVDGGGLSAEQHGGGVELVDDGRPGDTVAGHERLPIVDRRAHKAIVIDIEERTLALQGALGASVAVRKRGQFEPRDFDLRLQPEGHDLRVLPGGGLAINLEMYLVEGLLEPRLVCVRDVGRTSNRQGVALMRITQIEEAGELHGVVRESLLARLR